jgi:LPPG:FO 2-phospho-L-lactate transferase
MEAMDRLGRETWFRLGDKDLAIHVNRTAMLRSGRPLSEVTAHMARALGVRARLLPMSDDRVGTWLDTDLGPLPFQEYFVKHGASPRVDAVHYGGAAGARPGPGVLGAIEEASGIVLAPSNPLTSIGPILAVPGIRDALRRARAPTVAVSPIVGSRAVSGPAHRLMESLGWEPSPLGLVKAYHDFLAALVCEETEARTLLSEIRALGLQVLPTRTIMDSAAAEDFLAKRVLDLLGEVGSKT